MLLGLDLPNAILGSTVSFGGNWAWKVIKQKIENKRDAEVLESYQIKMYQAVICALNSVSGDRYKSDQDRVYQAAEKLMNGWSSQKFERDLVERCLDQLLPEVKDETCDWFIDKLCEEIRRDSDLQTLFLIRSSIDAASSLRNIAEDVKDTKQNMLEFWEELRRAITLRQSVSDSPEKEEIKFNDEKQSYIDKWRSRLFLHARDCDRPLTLEDIFILPNYLKGKLEYDRYVFYGEKEDADYADLEEELTSFFQLGKGSMIIFGCPGIGKTSIVSYLSARFKEDNSVLVLRFKELEFTQKDSSFIASICSRLRCCKKDLANKTLILDGFDELKNSADCQEHLKDLLLDIGDITAFKLIITSKENYIKMERIRTDKCILLKPFDEEKIKQFYFRLCNKELPNDTNLANKEVLGIPVILYMALSVGIDIAKNETRSAIYEKIFAYNGGIFDRFGRNKTDGDEGENQKFVYNKEVFKAILEKLSFVIFEGHGGAVEKEMYVAIVKEAAKKNALELNDTIIYDFPIKNLYKEGEGIDFVHKSIYEYFVAEYIYQEMKRTPKSEEVLAKVIGSLFKTGLVTDEIIDYLRLKWVYINIESEYFLKTLNLMLKKGMAFYIDKGYGNEIQTELNIFYNALIILQCWNRKGNEKINISEKKQFIFYMVRAFVIGSKLRLDNFNLNKSDLRRSNLIEASLIEADLIGADLSEANLRRASLRKSNLRKADLRKTDLRGADLIGANLREADLVGADLGGANLRGANLNGANLIEANLGRTNLSGAYLRGADLSGANLIQANLRGTDLNEAKLNGVKMTKIDAGFAKAAHGDLSKVIIIER